jgi:hypothetical protein
MARLESAGITSVEVNVGEGVLANPRPYPLRYDRAMYEPDDPLPLFARTNVMWALARHGGSLRIGPLLKLSGLSVDDLCAVLNELAQRRWLKVAWRRNPCLRLPERLARVDRVTATRFGRSRMIPVNRHAANARFAPGCCSAIPAGEGNFAPTLISSRSLCLP